MKKTTVNLIARIINAVITLFIAPLLMCFGWNIIAWAFNLPTFTYWQMFCIYLGLKGLATVISDLIPNGN